MSDYKSIASVAVLLLVVVIVLALGARITDETYENIGYTVEQTYSATDTNLNLNSSSAIQLSYTNLSSSTITVVNVTANVPITSANYTVDTVLGTVIGSASISVPYNMTTVNVTYNYDKYNFGARDAANNATTSISKLAKNTPILALVVIGSLIIGTVVTRIKWD